MFQGLQHFQQGSTHVGSTSTNTWILPHPRVALGMLQLPLEGSWAGTQKGTQQKAGNDAVSGNSSGKSGMDLWLH